MNPVSVRNLWAIFIALLLLTGCVYRVEDIDTAGRGSLVSSELLAEYSVEEVADLMDANIPPIFTQNIRPQYGLAFYRTTYYTEGTQGERVLASGVVVIPRDVPGAAPLFLYQHGTIFRKDEAPSAGPDRSAEALFAIVMGGQGFVSVLPDYLGLGEGEGLHPYLHAATEAAVGLDLLRVARSMAAEASLPLNGQLFLTGYSQGGHAVMALFKELETHHKDEFNVTAAVPMAGPYSMSGVMVDVMLSDDPYPSPSYLPYILFSYDLVYDLYDSPSDYLKAPYDTLLPPLFDGNYSGGDIDARMPSRPKEILRADVLQDFTQNMQHPLRLALRDNDLYDWRPRAPVKLIHCEGDDQVSAENSKLTYQTFLANGVADVELIQPDKNLGTLFNHQDCVLFAALEMVTWFVELKE